MLIVSQDRENDKMQAVTELLESLSRIVTQAAETGGAAHEVERRLWVGVLEMGYQLLKMYFELLGTGDEGEEVERDGQCLKRSPAPEPRRYLSVFGELKFSRWTYARGQKQRAYAPLDERAGLPKTKYSYVLQDWSQYLATELAYQPMQGVLARFLGMKVSVAALETMTRGLGATVDPWWESQHLPAAAQVKADQVTVLSADAKGVVMRTAATELVLAGRSQSTSSGPTPGKCKMAVLGAAYTVKTWERTPEQVLGALFGETLSNTTTLAANDPDYSKSRPTPCYKQVRAALSTGELGEPGHATAVIFPWLSQQLQQRDPDQQRPCVLLIDGQHTLWEQAAKHLHRTDRIEILDLLHALGYFWDAVHLFYPPGSHQAILLMEVMSLALLEGNGLTALAWLAHQAPAFGLDQAQRGKLDKIRAYFEGHRDRIHYDQYLAKGLPIASGVIEGACRHVVNDRLNRTGMRWTLEGAQAMLRLRCVAINGLWDELMTAHIQRETKRLYPHRETPEPVVSDIPQRVAA